MIFDELFFGRSTKTLSFEQYRFYLKKEIFDRLELEEVFIINVSKVKSMEIFFRLAWMIKGRTRRR